jgi:hypothetical protein
MATLKYKPRVAVSLTPKRVAMHLAVLPDLDAAKKAATKEKK